MTGFKIAIIHPSSKIQLVDCQPEEMMEIVVNSLGMTPDIMGDTHTCYETIDSVYQFCYLSKEDNEIPEDREFNKIATTLFDDKSKKLYGSIVLIKSLISNDNICMHESITLDDIEMLVDELQNHTGVLVKSDNGIEIFKFAHDPILSVKNPENYSFTDIEIFGFKLLLFIQLKPDNTTTNTQISTLLGDRRVEGDVIVTCMIDGKRYGKLDPDTLLTILKLATMPLEQRELTSDENQRGQKSESGLPKVINGHHILAWRSKSRLVARTELFPLNTKSLNLMMLEYVNTMNVDD